MTELLLIKFSFLFLIFHTRISWAYLFYSQSQLRLNSREILKEISTEEGSIGRSGWTNAAFWVPEQSRGTARRVCATAPRLDRWAFSKVGKRGGALSEHCWPNGGNRGFFWTSGWWGRQLTIAGHKRGPATLADHGQGPPCPCQPQARVTGPRPTVVARDGQSVGRRTKVYKKIIIIRKIIKKRTEKEIYKKIWENIKILFKIVYVHIGGQAT